MNKILCILIFLANVAPVFSQRDHDTLSMTQNALKVTYFKQTHQINFVDMRKIIKSDKEARQYYRRANYNWIGANLLTGGAFLLFSSALCEKYIEKKSVNMLVVSGISCGLLITCIPMRKSQLKHTRKAIHSYNNNLW